MQSKTTFRRALSAKEGAYITIAGCLTAILMLL